MKDVSVPMHKMQLYALPFLLLSGLLLVGYALIWGWEAVANGCNSFFELISFIPILILGAIAHEGLHGVGWKYAARLRWSDMSYGIQWNLLTPYAHSNQPMPKSAYLIGSLLPAIILGVIPYLIALIVGHDWLLMFGFVFTFSAGGDLWVVYKLRRVSSDAWVQDHAENAGCMVFDSREEAEKYV